MIKATLDDLRMETTLRKGEVITSVSSEILEWWMEQRQYKSISWTTRNGDVIPIQDMSNTHLANTIRMLERQLALEALAENAIDFEEYDASVDDYMDCCDILDKDYCDASDLD